MKTKRPSLILRTGAALAVLTLVSQAAFAVQAASRVSEQKTAEVKALIAKLESVPEIESVPLRLEIARALLASSPEDSGRYADRAAEIAELAGDQRLLVEARLLCARAAFLRNDHQAAIDRLEPNEAILRDRLDAPRPRLDAGQVRDIRRQAAETAELLAEAKNALQDYAGALRKTLDALPLRRELGDRPREASLLASAAAYQITVGDAAGALASASESLRIAEALNDDGLIAASAYLAAYAHRELEENDRALPLFERSLAAARRAKSSHYETVSLNEIGNLAVMAGDDARAADYKERALAAARASGSHYELAVCLNDVGYFHQMRGRARQALPYFEEALALNEKIGRARETAIVLYNIALVRLEMKEPRRAKDCIDRVLEIAAGSGLPKEKLQATWLLADIHRALGDYPKALDAAVEAYGMKDAVSNEESARRVADAQARFEVARKDQENEILKRDNALQQATLARRDAQRRFLIAVAASAVILAGIAFSRYRTKVRAHRSLESAHREISSQKARLDLVNRRLEVLAREDELTGLPNRRALIERLEQERIRFERSGRPFGLIMADLVGFKNLNDTYGHECGDRVLKACGRFIRAALRKQDAVGRWGGDEFLILLPETDQAGCRTVARKLEDGLAAEPIACGGRDVTAGLSTGASVYRAGLELADCVREADELMYSLRRRGRTDPQAGEA